MALKPYEEVADLLKLPIGSKTYTLTGISINDSRRFDDAMAEGSEVVIADEEFFRMFLRDAYDEMVADGVSFEALKRAGYAALADHQYGREVAEIMWRTGGVKPAAEPVKKPTRKTK